MTDRPIQRASKVAASDSKADGLDSDWTKARAINALPGLWTRQTQIETHGARGAARVYGKLPEVKESTTRREGCKKESSPLEINGIV